MIDVDNELLQIYEEECRRLIDTIEVAGLKMLRRENSLGEDELLLNVFRAFHTIKGSAYTLGYTSVGKLVGAAEQICQSYLSLNWRPGATFARCLLILSDELRRIIITPDPVDLTQAHETLSAVDGAVREQFQSGRSAVSADSAIFGEASRPVETIEIDSSDVRISREQFQQLQQQIAQLQNTVEKVSSRRGSDVIMRGLAQQTASVYQQLSELGRVSTRSLFTRLERVVVDTAEACGVKVQLNLTGEEHEIEAGILESLGEILPHIVRNAIDHGIESAEARLKSGKPEIATLSIQVESYLNALLIRVSDDGAGIDPEKIAATAKAKSIVPEAKLQQLSAFEKLQLIFMPRFSTRDTADRISGRGMGLDIVEQRVRQHGGGIEVQSFVGRGTSFEIRFPTRSALQKLLHCKLDGVDYGIPVHSIDEILLASNTEEVEDGALVVGEREIPIIGVQSIDPRFGSGSRPALLLKLQNIQVALFVDELCDFVEVITHSLTTSRTPRFLSGLARHQSSSIWTFDMDYIARNWNAFTVPMEL